MLFSNQTVAYHVSTEPDPNRTNLTGTSLAAAGTRIRSLAIVTLNTFHCGDSEVLIRFLTADDDTEERDLLRSLHLESDGVTIVCFDPATVRTTMRLRTMLLLDNQQGAAESLHRQLSAARWTAPGRPDTATSFRITASRKEGQCQRAAVLLLDELAGFAITPFGKAQFDRAAALLKTSADADGLKALAANVAIMRLAAL